ncbi:Bug family tripartite tricarboxylate transporter substrate binding protein [Sediminicoccus rosea]|uniref:Tripartite tricarboxylate transporter substrate binding protein n=1 Tax=Sediminicoccus rosea TaxID=1225128 RepID=A0ABZ0PC57_9PROT|nr:tripartite tricarboxylate transporter substrate binding protein [Sediminicoccus rosea]WPB83283.1 tripartite tricarboxylate transporter substrate binding protein [Sediminicoccus rosea]
MQRRALLALPLATPALASAQSLGERPVRLIVPYSAGGVADTVARILQQRVSENLGLPFIVENRTGASGAIGAGFVAQAQPDGHTLLLEGATSITGPLANRSLPFDYAAMPRVAQVTAAPYVLGIRAGFPGEDLPGFLAEARRRPGEVTFGTPGIAHVGHLMGELLQSLADVRLEHVPFRGGADAAREVAGGRIDACIISESSFSPVLRGERGRVIGVTGAARRPNLPGVPAIGEVVPGYELSTWMMIFAPPGTPMALRQRLSQAFAAAVGDPQLRDRIEASGNDPVSAGPEAAEALWQAERMKLSALMRRAGLVQG